MIHGLDQRPEQDGRRDENASRAKNPMERGFRFALVVSDSEREQKTGQNSSPVRPVVDPGQKQTEKDKPNDPPHRLAVDRLAVETTSALPIVEDGADQAADRGRGPDGTGDPGEKRKKKPRDAGAIMLKKMCRIPPWRKEAETRVHQRP